MISVQEASNIIMKAARPLGTITVPLAEATGKILQESLAADQDFPPFDRVMMDGIALNMEAWQNGRRVFKIQGMQTAGAPPLTLESSTNCLEVMTGAMLPQGTDVVVRYEDISVEDGTARVNIEELEGWKNIHKKGTDKQKGEVLLAKGTPISPAEIAVLATVGRSMVKVSKWPRVAIISTGDELVDVSEIPEPYQIRRSNSYALQSALHEWGVAAKMHHLPDDKDQMLEALRQILEDNDCIIMSGGVSKGKRDYVPEALDQLGVQQLFHRVKQRPGKPFWFGTAPGEKAVFAFPGNPVSAFMCFYRYFRPWLLLSAGISQDRQFAVLGKDFEFFPDLTYFLQVKVKNQDGRLTADPVAGRGSGDLANLLQADAFLELPAEQEIFRAGEPYPLVVYRA